MSNDQLPRWDKTTDHRSRYVTRPDTWVSAGAVWFSPASGMWDAHVRGVMPSEIQFATEAEAKAWVEVTAGLIGA
jgi:hypothetical protein